MCNKFTPFPAHVTFITIVFMLCSYVVPAIYSKYNPSSELRVFLPRPFSTSENDSSFVYYSVSAVANTTPVSGKTHEQQGAFLVPFPIVFLSIPFQNADVNVEK